MSIITTIFVGGAVVAVAIAVGTIVRQRTDRYINEHYPDEEFDMKKDYVSSVNELRKTAERPPFPSTTTSSSSARSTSYKSPVYDSYYDNSHTYTTSRYSDSSYDSSSSSSSYDSCSSSSSSSDYSSGGSCD